MEGHRFWDEEWRAELGHIVDGELRRRAEMEGQALDVDDGFVQLARALDWKITKDEGVRHWGVWHPKSGWWFKPGGEVYVTRHRALAEAQCLSVNQWGNKRPETDYRVRCIEEWADEQSG